MYVVITFCFNENFTLKEFEVLRNFKLLTKIEDKVEGGCLFRFVLKIIMVYLLLYVFESYMRKCNIIKFKSCKYFKSFKGALKLKRAGKRLEMLRFWC